MPTMPKSAEGFKFILVTVFMAIRTKQARIQGMVVLEVTISREGDVSDARILAVIHC